MPAVDRPLGAWRELPPLGATVLEPQLTAQSRAFAVDLAGSHRPDPILQPLGHDRAGDGLGGLVGGLVTPVVGMDVHSAVVPAPTEPAVPGPSRSHHAGRSGEASVHTGEGGEATRAASLPASLPAVAVARRLASVAPDGLERARSLTAVQPETVASPREAAGSHSAAPAASAAAGALASEADRDATSRSAADTGASTADGRVAAVRIAPVIASVPWRPGAVSRTFAVPAPSRRPGLGAPIDGPAPPLVRTAPMATTPVAHGEAVMPRPAPTARGGAALPLPVLGGAAAVHDAPRPSAAPDDAAGSVGAGDVSRSPSAAAPRSGTAMGLAPERQAARAARDEVSAAGGSGAAPPSGTLGTRLDAPRTTATVPSVPAIPGAGASSPSADSAGEVSQPARSVTSPGQKGADTSPAATFAAPPEGPLVRAPRVSAVSSPGSSAAPHSIQRIASSRAGISVPARAAGDASAHRTAGREALVRDFVRRAAAVTEPAEAGAPSGLARRQPAVAVGPERRAADPGLVTVVSAGPGAGFMLQRAVQVEEIPSEAAPQAGAQPAAGSGGAGTGGAGTGSIPGSGGAGPGAPGGATGPGASEADLDLLARRLYGRLRERLVRELMLDRERAGMLADR